MLAEFADHLLLIDAPQSEARTLAVIAKARELRPDTPLTTLVNTHHHFDPMAGVRAAVAEGLTTYFPRARVIFEVDAYGPTAPVHPYAANLLENITKRKLQVERISRRPS